MSSISAHARISLPMSACISVVSVNGLTDEPVLEYSNAMADDPKDESYSEEETVKRREAALQRMLNTPHKPHKDSKLGKKRESK